jgi:hypothetical protein
MGALVRGDILFGLRGSGFMPHRPERRHSNDAHGCHDRDILQVTPAALALDQQNGIYAVHTAPQPHWKYFWFD